MLRELYRRTGADPPGSDPAGAHGVAMEGYYWRLVDREAGRVVVALCGACRTRGEPWALVALAVHPGGHVRHEVVRELRLARDGLGVAAGGALAAGGERLAVRVPGAELDVALREPVRAGRRALGVAHLLPGLAQYWQPLVLDAAVGGELILDAERVPLAGARAYVEKNWGRGGFPRRWWWGHAGAFPGGDVTVAFAGGRVAPRLAASAVVARVGGETVALAPPAALVRSSAGEAGWRVEARGPRWRVEVEGEPGAAPHVLPVPDVATGTVAPVARQHLAGHVRLRVRRGRRLLYAGESPLAGLERGG